MADEKDKDKPLEPGDKKVDVEAKASVSDEKGEKTHEVDVKADATVRDLREKQAEKKAEEEEDETVTIQVGKTRVRIDQHDVDSEEAHAAASHAADRPTAKVAVGQTSRSFGSTGRPD